MLKSQQVWTGVFPCLDGTNALATPSVGPVGQLWVNGVANAASVAIAGTNPYTFTVTLPVLTAGSCLDMYITATIASVATAMVVARDTADTVRLSDGVTLATTQGAVTFGQIHITANAIGEGAVHIVNTAFESGDGIYASGQWNGAEYVGLEQSGVLNHGSAYGQLNTADTYGMGNSGGILDVRGDIGEIGTTAALAIRDAMKLAPTSGTPASGSIDEHLNDILTDTGTTLPAQIAIGNGGAGSETVTISCLDANSIAVEGVAVWVTSDLAGTTTIAGTLYSNSSGQVTMYLDPGTFYVWRQGIKNWTNPQTITVTDV